MATNTPYIAPYLGLPEGPPSTQESVLPFQKQLVEALNLHVNRVSYAMSNVLGVDVLANRNPTPKAPSLFYATDNGHLYVWDGAAWQTLI